jgi:hypothetical protein
VLDCGGYVRVEYANRSSGRFCIAWQASVSSRELREPLSSSSLRPGVSLGLTASDAGHLAIRYCGYAEFSLTRQIVDLAREGGTLVDVGANHGYFTCLWAARASVNGV